MGSLKNVAIIMDGNGRWAKERKRPRVWGHVKGAEVVREIVTAAAESDLESLTLYAFSTENWSRPTSEVTSLFKLLKKFLMKDRKTIINNNIQFDVIGNYRVLDSTIVEMIDELKFSTRANTGLCLSLAINYGGRAEIVDAVNSFLKENPAPLSGLTVVTVNSIGAKVLTIFKIFFFFFSLSFSRILNFLLSELL